MELEAKYNVNGVHIHHALQTNGLLLDAYWAEFLSRNRFLTGISIDGERLSTTNSAWTRQGKGPTAAASRPYVC